MQIVMETAPGAAEKVELKGMATVAAAAAVAGVDVGAGRCRATVNGDEAGPERRLRDGDRVLFAKRVEDYMPPNAPRSEVMRAALRGMKKYRNALRELAK